MLNALQLFKHAYICILHICCLEKGHTKDFLVQSNFLFCGNAICLNQTCLYSLFFTNTSTHQQTLVKCNYIQTKFSHNEEADITVLNLLDVGLETMFSESDDQCHTPLYQNKQIIYMAGILKQYLNKQYITISEFVIMSAPYI